MEQKPLDALIKINNIAENTPELGESYTDEEARYIDKTLTEINDIVNDALSESKNDYRKVKTRKDNKGPEMTRKDQKGSYKL